jgi:voltage-dependent anion channel protein 2
LSDSAAFELKLKAPDGLAINAKGTSPHSGGISSSVSGHQGLAL